MAVEVNLADIQKFMESKEGRMILGWLIGKNDKQIKAYLAKQAELLKAGDITAKGAIKGATWKTLGLLGAIYLARKQGTRAWNEATKVMNKDDITGLEKLGRAALELWPPTMTVRSFKTAWDWLTKKKSSNKVKQQSPEMMKLKEQSEKALYGISDEQLEIKNKQAKSNTDRLAAEMGMSPRPEHPLAQTEWKKEVERMKKTQKNFTNGPKWYFQGKADKLLSTTLTWSGLKNHTAKYSFVPAVALHVSLMLPTDNDRLLHHQIIANTNIEWQALRGKNTGAFNYTEEDVYTYDTTLASAIAVTRFVGKLLNLVNHHDPEVENLPVALLSCYACNLATHVTTGQTMYDDIIANRPTYLSQLNDVCKEINTYALKGKTLISRWNYIADKCLKDYNGDKAVYGYYALRNVPSLDVNNGITCTNLENQTIPQLLTYLRGQLTAIRTFNNGVLLKVAGDMIKLLGATTETFANVPYYTGAEVYKFDFDPEAYDQIRNAKVIPWAIVQVPNYARTQQAQYAVSLNSTINIDPAKLSIILDEYMIVSDRKREFIPEENLQMIQFVLNCTPTSMTPASTIHIQVDDCPTTTLDAVVTSEYNTGGTILVDTYTSIIADYNSAASPDIKWHGSITTQHSNEAGTSWMQVIAQIDFMPRYQMWKGDVNGEFQTTVIDVDNFAYITKRQVEQLNNVAVYSQTFVFNPEDVKILGILGN